MGGAKSSHANGKSVNVPTTETPDNQTSENMATSSDQMKGKTPKASDDNRSNGKKKKKSKEKKKKGKRTDQPSGQLPSRNDMQDQPRGGLRVEDVTRTNKELKDRNDLLENDREVREQQYNELNKKLQISESKMGRVERDLQGKLDTKEQELTRLKTDYKESVEDLQRKNGTLSVQIQELSTVKQDLEKKLHAAATKSNKMKTIMEQQQRMQEMETKIKALENEKMSLQKKHDDNLTNVASLMNQKMARDESDLENINMRNRPMIVMEEYNMFCSQEWLEAKSVLDDWVEQQTFDVQEKMLFELLTDAMFKCYDFCVTLLRVLMEHFETVLDNPLHQDILQHPDIFHYVASKKWPDPLSRISKITGKPDKRIELDQDFKVMIGKALKEKCDTINFKAMAEDFAKKFLETKRGSDIDASYAEKTPIQEYFTKCLQISWKMVIQQPPMKFVCDPPVKNKYNELKHELHYGSADPKSPSTFISAYIHPALFHGEKQMKKARVILALEVWSDKSDTSEKYTDSLYDNNTKQMDVTKTAPPGLFSASSRGSADNLHYRTDIPPAHPSTHIKGNYVESNPSGNSMPTAHDSADTRTSMMTPNPSSSVPSSTKQPNKAAREKRRSKEQGASANTVQIATQSNPNPKQRVNSIRQETMF